MVADILTKALPWDKHEKHMKGDRHGSVGEFPKSVGETVVNSTLPLLLWIFPSRQRFYLEERLAAAKEV
jgi:hypothetical protein